jgi:ferredoxin
VQLVIDRERCSGHGRCYTLAPGLVQADDDGLPVLEDPSLAAADPEAAEAAVRACPEGAISLQATG